MPWKTKWIYGGSMGIISYDMTDILICIEWILYQLFLKIFEGNLVYIN